METLLHGCVTWALGREHFGELRVAHDQLLPTDRFGFQRQQRTDHLMLHAKALKTAQCESVESVIRKRGLLFAGGVQRTTDERLTRRMMFGTVAGGENPRPGRAEKNWIQCLTDDFWDFQATEGSTEN